LTIPVTLSLSVVCNVYIQDGRWLYVTTRDMTNPHTTHYTIYL